MKAINRKLWTVDELALARELSPHTRPEEIARHLGRTLDSVKTKLCHMHISMKRRDDADRPWTEADTGIARTLVAGNASARTIGAALGRTQTAVYKMLRKLGIGLKPVTFWKPQEEEYLRSHGAQMTAVALEAILGRGRKTIRRKADYLGVVLASGRISRRVNQATRRDIRRAVLRPAPRVREPGAVRAAAAKKPAMPKVVLLRDDLGKKPPKRSMEPVSYIKWCDVCCAPVMNTVGGWAGHYERVGCNRKAKRA